MYTDGRRSAAGQSASRSSGLGQHLSGDAAGMPEMGGSGRVVCRSGDLVSERGRGRLSAQAGLSPRSLGPQVRSNLRPREERRLADGSTGSRWLGARVRSSFAPDSTRCATSSLRVCRASRLAEPSALRSVTHTLLLCGTLTTPRSRAAPSCSCPLAAFPVTAQSPCTPAA